MILCLVGAMGMFCVAKPSPDFEARYRGIVAQMTLDEKIGQMHGTRTKTLERIVVGLPHLGIPDLLA